MAPQHRLLSRRVSFCSRLWFWFWFNGRGLDWKVSCKLPGILGMPALPGGPQRRSPPLLCKNERHSRVRAPASRTSGSRGCLPERAVSSSLGQSPLGTKGLRLCHQRPRPPLPSRPDLTPSLCIPLNESTGYNSAFLGRPPRSTFVHRDVAPEASALQSEAACHTRAGGPRQAAAWRGRSH